MELVEPLTRERLLPFTLGANQFVGDTAFLSGAASAQTIRAVRDCAVIVVPRAEMLELMSRVPEMSDIIITVFAARRRRTIEDGTAPLVLIGVDEKRELRQVESFMSRNRLPYRTLDLPGIFAVGDVRAGSVKRVASAVGEGSVVISGVWEHVNAQPG